MVVVDTVVSFVGERLKKLSKKLYFVVGVILVLVDCVVDLVVVVGRLVVVNLEKLL